LEKNVVKWFLSESFVERIDFNTSLGKQWTRRLDSFFCCFKKVVMRSAHHMDVSEEKRKSLRPQHKMLYIGFILSGLDL
jgi:hypothetical protein